MAKTTDWFPSNRKPVRKGVYQRQYNSGICYCYFDGYVFCPPRTTAAKATQKKTIRQVSELQSLPWRGRVAPK